MELFWFFVLAVILVGVVLLVVFMVDRDDKARQATPGIREGNPTGTTATAEAAAPATLPDSSGVEEVRAPARRLSERLDGIEGRLDRIIGVLELIAASEATASPSRVSAEPPLTYSAPRDAAAKFLEVCDSRSMTLEAGIDWFGRHAPSLRLTQVEGTPADWTILRVAAKAEAVLLPAMRRPMGDCRLRDYFELANYNGFDPLHPRNVHRLPEQRLANGVWSTQRKGRIDAS